MSSKYFSPAHMYLMSPHFTRIFCSVHGTLIRVDPDITTYCWTPSPLSAFQNTSPKREVQCQKFLPRGTNVPPPQAQGNIPTPLRKTKLHLLMKEQEPQGFLSRQAPISLPLPLQSSHGSQLENLFSKSLNYWLLTLSRELSRTRGYRITDKCISN